MALHHDILCSKDRDAICKIAAMMVPIIWTLRRSYSLIANVSRKTKAGFGKLDIPDLLEPWNQAQTPRHILKHRGLRGLTALVHRLIGDPWYAGTMPYPFYIKLVRLRAADPKGAPLGLALSW